MKLKVGVFFGGNSVEHEVSIISALQAAYAFNKEKYEIVPVYIAKDHRMYVGEKIKDIYEYKDIEKLLRKSKEVVLVKSKEKFQLVYYPFKKIGNSLCTYIDVAFPIVHGTNVEDGTLQGYLKHIGIPFVGSDVLSSAVAMDKYVTKVVLKDKGIPVLECSHFNQSNYLNNAVEILDQIESTMSYPVIIKPCNLGSGVGIKIAKSREYLVEAIEHAFQFSKHVVVERAITSLREITCAVLGNNEEVFASECDEPITKEEIISYKNEYLSQGDKPWEKSKGSTRKLPAQLTELQRKTVEDLAIRTFQALDCQGIARIDFIIDLDEDHIYVSEINTIPGALAFYLMEPKGVSFSELLDKMIQLALNRYKADKEIIYSFETNILANNTVIGIKGDT